MEADTWKVGFFKGFHSCLNWAFSVGWPSKMGYSLSYISYHSCPCHLGMKKGVSTEPTITPKRGRKRAAPSPPNKPTSKINPPVSHPRRNASMYIPSSSNIDLARHNGLKIRHHHTLVHVHRDSLEARMRLTLVIVVFHILFARELRDHNERVALAPLVVECRSRAHGENIWFAVLLIWG